MTRLATRTALVLLTALVGCSINPVSKRPEVVLLSSESEQRIGAQEAKKVQELMGLMDEGTTADYVRSIGERLAKHSPREDLPYQFFVVDMVEPNAFALPGGYVYVSRGLVALANDESELAGTIGHEIGHVAARHSVQRLTLAAPFALISAVPGAIVGIFSPALGSVVAAPGALAGGAVLSPYGRGQENEADRVGVDMAAAAGWDPEGLARMLTTLRRAEVLRTGKEREGSFFDSHPDTGNRVERTMKRAAEATRADGPPPIAGTRASFLAKLDGLLIGPDPREGLFLEQRLVHPVLGFEVDFPEQWKTVNARRAAGASHPDGHAVIALQVAAKGGPADPVVAGRMILQQGGAKEIEPVERMTIGGLAAARAVAEVRTQGGKARVHMTWIRLHGLLYQLTGLARPKRFEEFRPAFDQVAQSFRRLPASEAGKLEEIRLRVAKARAGETLEQLAKRTRSQWDAPRLAVANGIEEGAPLTAGQLLKVPVAERYSGPVAR